MVKESSDKIQGTRRVTNRDLTCKDCQYRRDDSTIFGNTTRCEMFPKMKPTEVINKRLQGICLFYKKETNTR